MDKEALNGLVLLETETTAHHRRIEGTRDILNFDFAY